MNWILVFAKNNGACVSFLPRKTVFKTLFIHCLPTGCFSGVFGGYIKC